MIVLPKYDHLQIPAPTPCTHGNGENCDCQLPWFKGLYVVTIDFKHDQKQRTLLVKMRTTYGGGMVEFIDPVSGVISGCAGVNWANKNIQTIEEFIDRRQLNGNL